MPTKTSKTKKIVRKRRTLPKQDHNIEEDLETVSSIEYFEDDFDDKDLPESDEETKEDDVNEAEQDKVDEEDPPIPISTIYREEIEEDKSETGSITIQPRDDGSAFGGDIGSPTKVSSSSRRKRLFEDMDDDDGFVQPPL